MSDELKLAGVGSMMEFSAAGNNGDGWIFMGLRPMTEVDVQLLRDYLLSGHITDEPHIDPLTVVGRWDASWDHKAHADGLTEWKPGGLGSDTYQVQHLGKGVFPFHHKPRHGHEEVWHINPKGQRVWAKLDYPRTGIMFHYDEEHQAVAGPRPKSQAAKRLGKRGRYVWDDTAQLYKIERPHRAKKKAPKA